MSLIKKLTDETTFCVCDRCKHAKTCKEECQAFIDYTKASSESVRKLIFNNFIKLQGLVNENKKTRARDLGVPIN